MKVLREFPDCKLRTYIYEDTDDVKVIGCEVDGNLYRFNAEWIPENDLEWFAGVYSSQLYDLRKNTQKGLLKQINEKKREMELFLKGEWIKG